MSDIPKDDPRFPTRPQHPDFWRISEIVREADHLTESGKATLEEMLADVVDANSLAYISNGRGSLAFDKMRGPATIQTMLGAVWRDAFYAGVRFQQLGGHQ